MIGMQYIYIYVYIYMLNIKENYIHNFVMHSLKFLFEKIITQLFLATMKPTALIRTMKAL